MAIDMEQFKATFVEESREGLDTMESVLLEMQPGAAEAEDIDTIFRAAHSIKGGSATFGFEAISSFTHGVETLLDQIRGGQRAVTQEAIGLFLRSVDCIRELLAAAQDGSEADPERVAEIKAEIDRLLDSDGGGENPADTDTAPSPAAAAKATGWQIRFKPFPNMLRTGNDVVRMFRELAEMGELSAKVDTGSLPALVDMEPEEACLSWQVTLAGDIGREQLDEVFEWVDGDCELSITPLEAAAAAPAAE